MGGIYHIINKVSGKKYIGSSIDVRKRIESHFQYSGCKKLREDIKKLGRKNFEAVVISYCENEATIREVEQAIINIIPKENLYNKQFNCFLHPFKGKSHTPESIQKNRLSNQKNSPFSIPLMVEYLNGIVKGFSSIRDASRNLDIYNTKLRKLINLHNPIVGVKIIKFCSMKKLKMVKGFQFGVCNSSEDKIPSTL